MLRKIFRPKREEVGGGCIRLYSEVLHNLYASLNIMGVIISRRMRWTRNVARMRAMTVAYKVLV
jgi:hypothetical protein